MTSEEEMKSLDELMEQAYYGKLSPKEIAYVAKIIENSKPGDDDKLYASIYILGKAYAIEYRDLVEKFLYYPSQTDISSRALSVLCSDWGLTKEYLKEVKMFIKGVEWDDNDIRLSALRIAGNYLRKKFDQELLMLLVETFENLGHSDYIIEFEEYRRTLNRSVAYQALARAVGKDWDDPLFEDDDNIEMWIENGQLDRLDTSIIQKAHQLLNENGH